MMTPGFRSNSKRINLHRPDFRLTPRIFGGPSGPPFFLVLKTALPGVHHGHIRFVAGFNELMVIGGSEERDLKKSIMVVIKINR